MTTAVLRAKTIDLVTLVKPRIMVMSVLTAAGGMSLAPGAVATITMLWLLAGTALIVGSANTLNMWLERDIDCLMSRTKNRPLPQGRLDANTALWFGGIQGVLAVPVLGMVNPITAALGLLALLLYVGVYTPMKQRSHWAVWVGSVPGAIPALMGWTAATGHIEIGGLAVFGVLFIWQVPHFHAIAMYRQREYAAAGLKTLPGTHGERAAKIEIIIYLVVQVLVSLTLVPLGVTGLPYLITAVVLGALVLVQGASGFSAQAKGDASRWARNVFLTSIVYLPVLFIVMVLDGRA